MDATAVHPHVTTPRRIILIRLDFADHQGLTRMQAGFFLNAQCRRPRRRRQSREDYSPAHPRHSTPQACSATIAAAKRRTSFHPGRHHPSRGGDGQNDADQSQVTPAAHLRTARRACRRAGVPTQRPFTRCMPAPHASRTLMTMSSDCWSGVGGIACAEEVKASANATAITRIIDFLLFSCSRREGRRRQHTSHSHDGWK
jgi:hypothetical protein